MNKLLFDVDEKQYAIRHRAYCMEERKWIGNWGAYEKARANALRHQRNNQTHEVDIIAEQHMVVTSFGPSA